MGWILYGSVNEDAGDFGGDIQVGKAASIRFQHTEMPGRLVTVTVYPTAPELETDDQPECLHKEVGGKYPAEHMRCSWYMDEIGLEMQSEFMICGDIDDPGSTEEWSTYEYQELESAPYTGTVEEMLKAAEADALSRVRRFNAERDIVWDGKRF